MSDGEAGSSTTSNAIARQQYRAAYIERARLVRQSLARARSAPGRAAPSLRPQGVPPLYVPSLMPAWDVRQRHACSDGFSPEVSKLMSARLVSSLCITCRPSTRHHHNLRGMRGNASPTAVVSRLSWPLSKLISAQLLPSQRMAYHRLAVAGIRMGRAAMPRPLRRCLTRARRSPSSCRRGRSYRNARPVILWLAIAGIHVGHMGMDRSLWRCLPQIQNSPLCYVSGQRRRSRHTVGHAGYLRVMPSLHAPSPACTWDARRRLACFGGGPATQGI
jgi:hypothetical protein